MENMLVRHFKTLVPLFIAILSALLVFLYLNFNSHLRFHPNSNAASINCLFATVPLMINVIADISFSKSVSCGGSWSWLLTDNSSRLMVAFTVLVSDIPLALCSCGNTQLGLVCGQSIILSSIMLENCNCGLSRQKCLSISSCQHFLGTMMMVMLFLPFSVSHRPGQVGLLVFAGVLALLLISWQFVAIIRQGLGQWRNHGKSHRALWFHLAFFVHVVLIWAMCLRYMASPNRAVHLVQGLCYVQLIPVLGFSCFHDIFQNKPSLATLVSNSNRDFVRFISHELRSHLSFLSFGLLHLKDGSSGDGISTSSTLWPRRPPARKGQLLGELQESCDAAVQVLDEVLVFDRLRNEESHNKTLVDVKLLLRRAIDNIESRVSSILVFLILFFLL